MAKVRFSIDSLLPAETVLGVATDFSDSRPRYWPNIAPRVYMLHSKSATSADVTEGSAVFGGIWGLQYPTGSGTRRGCYRLLNGNVSACIPTTPIASSIAFRF